MPSEPPFATTPATDRASARALFAALQAQAQSRGVALRPHFIYGTRAVGSANLDNRSFRLNFEIMVITVDEGFARDVEAMLEEDFAQSVEMTLDDRRRVHRLQQLGMRVARLGRMKAEKSCTRGGQPTGWISNGVGHVDPA